MRFWVYIPPHDALCPSNVPPKISLKTANLLMREGQYIRVQSISLRKTKIDRIDARAIATMLMSKRTICRKLAFNIFVIVAQIW